MCLAYVYNKFKVHKLGPRYHDARYIIFSFTKSSNTYPYILTLKNIHPCVYNVHKMSR